MFRKKYVLFIIILFAINFYENPFSNIQFITNEEILNDNYISDYSLLKFNGEMLND